MKRCCCSPSSGTSSFSRVLYATQFGADPTGTVDSTVALQSFLDATASQRRKGIIPAGTYLVSAQLNTNGPDPFVGGVIEGDGKGITTLRWVGPINDGQAMLVWSRYQSVFRDITLDANIRASYGLVLHAAAFSKISVNVINTFSHGIILHNSWGGLPAGSNAECVLDQCRIGPCGRDTIYSLQVTGADGGTYTLTVNGQTTAAIPWNADGPTIQAALESAITTAKRQATSSSTFLVVGNSDNAAIYLWGTFAGEDIAATIDGTNLTGPGPSAQLFYSPDGVRGNGIHTVPASEGGADHATLAIFEPSITACVGNAIYNRTFFLKVWGGHFEGNRDCGIMQEWGDGIFVTDNMYQWPYFESNPSGGIVNYGTVRTWAAIAAGSQGMYDIQDAANMQLVSGNRNFGGMFRDSTGTGRVTSLGIGESGYGLEGRFINLSGPSASFPTPIARAFDPTVTDITIDADQGLLLNGNNACGWNLTLNANITSLLIGTDGYAQEVMLRFIHLNIATATVGWSTGGVFGFVFAGNTPPTLGTGGVGTCDIICFRFLGLRWVETSRSLAVPLS